MTPAIFLDKDGTVLADVPYNVDPQAMRFAPGAAAGLALLATLDVPLIVVSNQPGIALGVFDFKALRGMHRHLRQMFHDAGAELAAFYYCPHHPLGSLGNDTPACSCRKPQPGMLRRAAQRHQVDLQRSWMVGDILDDVEAGRRAGCHTVLIDNGNETEWLLTPWRQATFSAPDLQTAAQFIVQQFHPTPEVLP